VRHDLEETRAIKGVFGKHAYELGVSSTKSMHGHPIGAAPAFEAVACVKALEDGVMPPTIGLEEADPECDLDYVPGTARKKKLAYVQRALDDAKVAPDSISWRRAPPHGDRTRE